MYKHLQILFSFLSISIALYSNSVRADTTPDLVFRINEDLGTLDWGFGEVKQLVVQQLMVGLTTVSPMGKAEPAIAASWKQEGEDFDFQLRKDAKWSDGKTICAQDFIDAWDRVRSKELASPFKHYFDQIESYSSKECHSLRIRAKSKLGYLPELLSHWVFYPVRLDLIKKFGDKWFAPENLVVTGPYLLKEWKRDTVFNFEVNPKFFGKAPKFRTLRALVVSDDSAALNLYETGKLDWIRDLPVLERAKLRKRSDYKEFETLVGYHLGFRKDVPQALRCAVARGLDKNQIPKVLNGGAKPALALYPLKGVAQDLSFDLKAARQSLEGLSLAEKEKFQQGLEFFYYAKQVHIPLMEWVQGELKKNLGLEVKIIKREEKTYWSELQDSTPPVFLSGTTAPYSHPYSFVGEFISGTAANWGKYSSTDYDAFASKIAQTESGNRDGAALASLLSTAQKKIGIEDCMIIPLYFRTTTALIKKNFMGLTVNPMGYTYLNKVSH